MTCKSGNIHVYSGYSEWGNQHQILNGEMISVPLELGLEMEILIGVGRGGGLNDLRTHPVHGTGQGNDCRNFKS